MANVKVQGSKFLVAWDEQMPTVAVVTIANPKKANALDARMLSEIEALNDDLAKARAIVVTGEGDRHFCSGADINSWAPMTPEQFASDWLRKGIGIFDRFAALPGCVIVAINGTCFGGGLELALRADVRICASTARFAFPETGIGAIPGWTGGSLLAEQVGHSLASEMVLCGRVLSAEEAKEAELVSSVHDQKDLLHVALDLARQAAKRSPVANAAAKRLLRSKGDLTEAHVKEGAMCKGSDDGKEGLAAFAEKRPPEY